jgi:hypothetical protein
MPAFRIVMFAYNLRCWQQPFKRENNAEKGQMPQTTWQIGAGFGSCCGG